MSTRLPLQLQKFKNQHFQRIWCCEFEVPAVGYRNPLRKGEWKKIVISNKKNIVIKILGICAQTSKCCSQDDDVVRIFRNSAESRLSLQLYQACPGLKTKIQQQRRINLPEVNKTFYHFRSAGQNTQTLRCIESDQKKILSSSSKLSYNKKKYYYEIFSEFWAMRSKDSIAVKLI